jgi:hypothetical protein
MKTPGTDSKNRNEEVDFHAQRRSNATHVSTTDPGARVYRKGPGKEAKLSFMGHAMTEKPERPCGRDRLHTGHRCRRAGGGQGNDPLPRAWLNAAPHARRRQGL